MTRKVTAEERQVLLDNPELVMFEAYPAMNNRTIALSLGKILIFPFVILALIILLLVLFPDAMNKHPTLYPVLGVVLFTLSLVFIPFLYFYLDDRDRKKARANHYSEQLRKLLPKDLDCKVVLVYYVTVEKAEGGYIDDDGEEGFIGYVSCVNYFQVQPQTDLAIVYSEKARFCAYIKRDSRTECFYRKDF